MTTTFLSLDSGPQWLVTVTTPGYSLSYIHRGETPPATSSVLLSVTALGIKCGASRYIAGRIADGCASRVHTPIGDAKHFDEGLTIECKSYKTITVGDSGDFDSAGR